MRNDSMSFKSRWDHARDVEQMQKAILAEKCSMVADTLMDGVDPSDVPELVNKAQIDGPRAETTDLHINGYLTTFVMNQIQSMDNFQVVSTMPSMPVNKRSDRYVIWDTDSFLTDEMELRNDTEEVQLTGFEFSDDNFFCDWYSIGKLIGLIAENEADAPINLRRTALRFLAHKVLQNKENKFVETFMPDITSTNAATESPWDKNEAGSGKNIFSKSYTGDLIDQVTAAAYEREEKTGGFKPQVLMITSDVRQNLVTNDDILDRINGGANVSNPALIKNAMIAAALEVEQVVVLKAVSSSAKKGASKARKKAARAYTAKNKALLYYREPTLSAEGVNAIARFDWQIKGMPAMGVGVSQYYNRERRSNVMEADCFYDMKVVGDELAVYWPGAVTATA